MFAALSNSRVTRKLSVNAVPTAMPELTAELALSGAELDELLAQEMPRSAAAASAAASAALSSSRNVTGVAAGVDVESGNSKSGGSSAAAALVDAKAKLTFAQVRNYKKDLNV